MKNLLIITLFVSFMSFHTWGKQEAYIKHKVKKNETITQIAKKYQIAIEAIYKLNPNAENGIQEGSILLIPNQSQKNIQNKNLITHTVLAGETLYGISKKYDITIENLQQANEILLKKGLQAGQTIVIPTKNKPGTTVTTANKTENKPKETTSFKPGSENEIIHEVQSGETKFSIAKRYGISVNELEKQNPDVKKMLPAGYSLRIKTKNTEIQPTEITLNHANQNQNNTESKKTEKRQIGTLPSDPYSNMRPTGTVYRPGDECFNDYIVKPKETLYSLSNLFGMSESELIELNPSLKNGVKEGMILNPSKDLVKPKPKQFVDLSKTIDTKTRKELVLFLPFNASTATTAQNDKNKSKFLDMTLDFYSGALMAIDTAKKMGLNIDIRIFDSEETKNTSNTSKIIKDNDFSQVSAVIGPFFQSNVEHTASSLKNYNTPVVSPLSKELNASANNLFQSIPPTDIVKIAMLDYLKTKQANVIAVIDPKKGSSRRFLAKHYPEVPFVAFNDRGMVNEQNLKSLLVKDQVNYVIIETETAGLILNTSKILVEELANYTIKLVALEKNESFDHNEISSTLLMKLGLHYPSISRDIDFSAINTFYAGYKKKNNIYPNQFVIRGFDVTLDVLLRLAQDDTFVNTAEDLISEQLGSRFEYDRNPGGGYVNKGVYILYYDTDLTIKSAK